MSLNQDVCEGSCAGADGPALDRSHERLRKAWLASARQDLLAPANAIIEISASLFRDLKDHERTELAADLCKIEVAGKLLTELINEILDAAKVEAGLLDLQPEWRHKLRTPLNHVIGYCDLWLEETSELLMESFAGDLQRLKGLARQLLVQIDDLLVFAKKAGDPNAATSLDDVPRMIQEVVNEELQRPVRVDSNAMQKGRILVVDDNPANRDLLVRQLLREGHQLAEAVNGRDALEQVRSQSFDLVLLDVVMPELNGFQVLEQLRADAELRHIPVIMISALHEMDSVVRCVERGAEDYLCKPFDPVLLKARINASLEKKRFRDREVQYLKEIDRERQRSDELLHVILPGPIVEELKATQKAQPRRHENVAVMFCDIVGFTPFCDRNEPEYVVAYLQQLIECWEEIALRHQVEKIKTIGDAMMAAAGLLQPTPNPVLNCVNAGLEMIASVQRLPVEWNVRVGIHAGPVVAGVIGRRQFLFDLWGDTVNTAARMESHGVPGAVVLSDAAWQQVAHCCLGQTLGRLKVKGKGEMDMVRFEGFCP